MKNYDEVIDFMFSSLPMYQRIGAAAYKNDLSTSLKLDEYFEKPHQYYKTIHIAGTNGKGSVSNSLASVLQDAGYKVGLYTSPHLTDYRERIRINGEMISKEFVCDFINNNQQIINELKPSFFEMTSEMAFVYFKEMKVDIAVIEVGMGGRLDSTNVINPILSIITNISYDHTQFLGNTLAKIAKEKAGIIKHNVPVIIGENNAKTKKVFIEIAKNQSAEIKFAKDYFKTKLFKKSKFNILSKTDKKNIIVDFQLKGHYQLENLNTIFTAIELLRLKDFKISDQQLINGLENITQNTHFQGRWQIIKKYPLTICDIGHNKAGLEQIIKQLEEERLGNTKTIRKLHIVLGFVNDKNVSEILKIFPKDVNVIYYFTQASVPRALDVDILFEEAKKAGLKGKSYKNVETAYKNAVKNANNEDIVFVGGSTFVVADFLEIESIY